MQLNYQWILILNSGLLKNLLQLIHNFLVCLAFYYRLRAVPPFWQTSCTSQEKLVKKRLILACHKKLLEWHGCKAAALGVRRLKSRGYLLSPRVWILCCAHKAKIWLAIGRKSLKKWSSVSTLVNVSDGWWLA